MCLLVLKRKRNGKQLFGSLIPLFIKQHSYPLPGEYWECAGLAHPAGFHYISSSLIECSPIQWKNPRCTTTWCYRKPFQIANVGHYFLQSCFQRECDIWCHNNLVVRINKYLINTSYLLNSLLQWGPSRSRSWNSGSAWVWGLLCCSRPSYNRQHDVRWGQRRS